MTAIAGAISFSSDAPLDVICASALEAQSAYGRGQPNIFGIAGAAFGMDIFPTVPEDRFDRQPLADNRFMLVADVRLDNRDDLLALLGEAPIRFSDRSDAEILFLTWTRWEERSLDRIVGDFAFAVYDQRQRQLTLARDHTGARPLSFIVESGGLLRFASMPSGVAASAGLRPSLGFLARRLAGSPTADGWTCFENVRTVGPGERVTYSAGGLSRNCYWDPARRYETRRPLEQTAAELRDRLEEAVRPAMRRQSDALALHLSSGYDSSAIAGTAARLRQQSDRLIAFTSAPASSSDLLQFRGRFTDESALAAETASVLGIGHVVVRSSTPLLDGLRGHARYYQQPVANIFNEGWRNEIARQARASGARTLLTGAAGNFTISYGGLPVLAYWLRTGRWWRWLQEAHAAVEANDVRWRGVLYASFDPWLSSRAVRFIERFWNRVPAESETRFVRREWDSVTDGLAMHTPTTGDPFGDRLELIRTLDPAHQRKGLLGQTGIDERDPTADRRLTEFCLAIAPEQLLCKGIYKAALRAALADRVPQKILNLGVRGYQGADWYSRLRPTDMMAIVEEFSPGRASELIDIPAVKQAIANWPRLDPTNISRIASLGRRLTNALAAGTFIREVERDPNALGRK